MRRRTIRVAISLAFVLASACAKDKKSAPKVDTLSDSAATASAKALSRAATGTSVSMTVNGSVKYDGQLNGRATCSYGGDNSSPTTKVEAFGRDAQVSFEIVKPTEGTIPVKSGIIRKRSGSRIANLQFVVHSQTYGDGNGSATITDPVGRVGSLSARHFSKIGTGKRHGSDLSITVHWECE